VKNFVLVFVLALAGFINSANANSYLEMITQPPADYSSSVTEESVFDDVDQSDSSHPPLWYDYRITTASPVVFSPYPKYLAWQRAKARENKIEFDEHEFIQNLIYTTEGGLAAFGLYQIYKYH
jgi:hypothetical protein